MTTDEDAIRAKAEDIWSKADNISPKTQHGCFTGCIPFK